MVFGGDGLRRFKFPRDAFGQPADIRAAQRGDGYFLVCAINRHRLQRRLLGALVVLGGHADELLEVLDATLGLERVLALEHGRVAALVEHPPHERSDRRRRRRRGPPGVYHGVSPSVWASVCSRPIAVGPRPRRGMLTMRSRRCSSAGLLMIAR